MISPTGKNIREDAAGSGKYGSPRGNRLHKGVDYYCEKGQEIVAPFNMTIKRKAYPYHDMKMEGIEWAHGESTGYMFYFKVRDELVGKYVKQGQVIGEAQSISKYYSNKEMHDHIHFQINK